MVHPPRKVPVAVKKELKCELERLEKERIIKLVSEPTSWMSSMVLAREPNEDLEVCIDPKDLNKVLKRSHCITSIIEGILPELNQAKIFSTFDVKNGFWYIELEDEISFLTTFNTSFGRFRWLQLPLGISSAPEEFKDVSIELLEVYLVSCSP